MCFLNCVVVLKYCSTLNMNHLLKRKTLTQKPSWMKTAFVVCFWLLKMWPLKKVEKDEYYFLTCDDLSEQLLRSIPKERHTAHQELIEDDAHGPPVHRLSITLTENHLRSDVLWSATYLSDGEKVEVREDRQRKERKERNTGWRCLTNLSCWHSHGKL